MALRAYVHFDLLRMFAPADFSGVDKVLPYVKEFSKQVVAYSTPKEFVDLVVADLTAAAQLLKTDPLVTGEEITTDEDKGYLINRQFHMNYYAVQGLLARVQLYAGRNMEARTAAWEVVEAHEQNGLFPWIKRDDITVSEKALRDRTFSSELLFALNIRKLVDYIKPYFRESSREPCYPVGISVRCMRVWLIIVKIIYLRLPGLRLMYVLNCGRKKQ